MSIFSSYKKIFLLGFIIVILIAIPFSVYLAQKRQNITSKATASTTLSFEPVLATAKVGDTVTLNVMLNPGTGTSANQVSFVKLSINFDPAKFTTLPADSLMPNTSGNTLTNVIDTAQYDNTVGTAKISLSIGADPANAVKTKTKIAILKLKATAATAPTNPNITFDFANTQVLSIDNGSQTSDNVLLSTTVPATVTVTAIATPSPTPTTLAPPPGSGGGLPPSSLAPVCSGLEVNGLTNGTAPYPLTFTATGNAVSGTIAKISFNFGDSTEDLTTGGGIGTSTVSGQLSHTYNTPGIYTAYAILTDNSNNLSVQQDSCTKTITISTAVSQPIPQPLPPTGDGRIMFGLGAMGIILTIIGGALLFL